MLKSSKISDISIGARQGKREIFEIVFDLHIRERISLVIGVVETSQENCRHINLKGELCHIKMHT